MKKIILNAIETAEKYRDMAMIELIKNLLDEFARTYNAPSNWIDLKEDISLIYQDESSWVYNQLELWDL